MSVADEVRSLPHRPYARIRSSEPSVTTILGLLPKPGLPWAAAKETAMFAVLHQDRWQDLDEVAAVDVLRKHHRGIWDGRAAMGTLCHGVLESYVAGQPVDVEALIDETIATDRNARTWAEQDRDDLVESCLGYVLGIESWWERFGPEEMRAEVCVRTPGVYVGQTDLRCSIGGIDTLIDLKTTAKQDEGSGIYADSWTLQLAAYGHAEETVTYEVQEDNRGRTRVVEVGTGPWSAPERFAVLHLRGDEGYRFYEVPSAKDAHETFLALAHAHAWLKSAPETLAVIA